MKGVDMVKFIEPESERRHYQALIDSAEEKISALAQEKFQLDQTILEAVRQLQMIDEEVVKVGNILLDAKGRLEVMDEGQ